MIRKLRPIKLSKAVQTEFPKVSSVKHVRKISQHLINSSRYFLNNGRCKYVQVGLCSSDLEFEPVLRIVIGYDSVILDRYDWKHLLDSKKFILSYFIANTNVIPESLHYRNVTYKFCEEANIKILYVKLQDAVLLSQLYRKPINITGRIKISKLEGPSQGMNKKINDQYVAALDVGTTSIRCQIINSKAICISSASIGVNLIYPQPGYVEIDPDDLWRNVCYVIKESIKSANLNSSQIKCLGISTQRATFTTWRKDSGKPFHNFITWKDLRSDALVRQWNCSLAMKGFRMGCYGLYLISRSKRFLAGSSIKLANTQSTVRLVWVLQNIPELKQAVENKNALFGTVDTWLIYKFTSGRKHVTDISNASATGFFDPFILNWSAWANIILHIPSDILPEIVDNDYLFGSTQKDLFGVSIPIKCVISDQSASMFGSCCFNPGDIKVTLGTGSFLDVNNNHKIHASAAGLYPLVGWKLHNEIIYFVEGACNDAGSVIQWAIKSGIIENPQESSRLANEVEHSDGVYFIPAFSGLGPPIMDDNAASGFIGLKVTSTKQHMIRSILESIVYRITLLYNMIKMETDYKIKSICVDGGVSSNDFVCQLLANVVGVEVERPSTTEMTLLGAAFIAGLKSGVWKSKNELKQLRSLNTVFKPALDISVQEKLANEFQMWLRAVERFKSWNIKLT